MIDAATSLSWLPAWIAPARAAAWLYGVALLAMLGSLGIAAVSHLVGILNPASRPNHRMLRADTVKAAALLASSALVAEVARSLGAWNSTVFADAPWASAVASCLALGPILIMATWELACRSPGAQRLCCSTGFACTLAAIVSWANRDCLAITSIRTHGLDGNLAPLAALAPSALAYATISGLIGLAVCRAPYHHDVSKDRAANGWELPIFGIWLAALLVCSWTVLASDSVRAAVYDPVADLPSNNPVVNGLVAKTAVVGFCAASGLIVGWLLRLRVPRYFPAAVRTYLIAGGVASAMSLAIGMYWLSGPSARLTSEYAQRVSAASVRAAGKESERPFVSSAPTIAVLTNCGYCHAPSGRSALARRTAGMSHPQLLKLLTDLRSADELASRYRGWMPPFNATDAQLDQGVQAIAELSTH